MSHLTVALALIAPLAGLSQSPAHARPEIVCRATLEGSGLVTTVQHPNGHRMQGIWTVVTVRRRAFDQPTELQAELLLDHLMEFDSRDGRRADIPVAVLFRMELKAADPLDALRHAIGAWCGTVLRAWDEGLPFDRLGPANRWWQI